MLGMFFLYLLVLVIIFDNKLFWHIFSHLLPMVFRMEGIMQITFWTVDPKSRDLQRFDRCDQEKKNITRINHTLIGTPLFNEYEGIIWFIIGGKTHNFKVTNSLNWSLYAALKPFYLLSISLGGQATLSFTFLLKSPTLATLAMLSTPCFIMKIFSTQWEYLQLLPLPPINFLYMGQFSPSLLP